MCIRDSIATDEIRTYAMFNYEQIEWITHQDNYEGLKGAAAFVSIITIEYDDSDEILISM